MYDDSDKHTNAYKKANLLIRNPSSREAYPRDIFYIHTRLLKRAAQFSKYYGYSSLTALPVVKIKRDNLNTYIPTNLISITDGQRFLRTDYSKKRLYPASDIEKSVSKIRRKAQSALMSWISGDFKSNLLSYLRITELLSMRVSVSNEQRTSYNSGLAALSV